MLNNSKTSKIRQVDDVKETIFDNIVEGFKAKFRKDIDFEDIFLVAETQAIAIEDAFEKANNIRCMYLGSFKVAPSLLELAVLRKQFIEAGNSPHDAQRKAVDSLNMQLADDYKESMSNNSFGKKPKKKTKKDVSNKRINKCVHVPLGILSNTLKKK